MRKLKPAAMKTACAVENPKKNWERKMNYLQLCHSLKEKK